MTQKNVKKLLASEFNLKFKWLLLASILFWEEKKKEVSFSKCQVKIGQSKKNANFKKLP